MKPKVLLSWSTGKDAAWTLHVLRAQGAVDVIGLLTVVSRGSGRVAMHAVREALLEQQAESAGVPLWKAEIPDPCPPDAYASEMSSVVERARTAGVTQFAFGDLYLEDVRSKREQNLVPTGLTPIFPLWGRDPRQLARQMVAEGVRATLISVDPKQLAPSFCGRIFDSALLDELPLNVDPCGERGEFHTFVFAGPMLRRPIPIVNGPTTERDGYYYTDVLPAPPSQSGG